jgi:hypothetical protein
MRLYTVVTVDDYIPRVRLSTPDRNRVLNYAREWAGDWDNEITGDAGEIYFNQKEDGSMEYAVSVQVSEVEQQTHADEGTRKDVEDLAHSIFNNDGIEEFVPELVDFARVAVKDSDGSCSDAKLLKAATHAAFGAMLLGISLREAVDMVLSSRGDILE